MAIDAFMELQRGDVEVKGESQDEDLGPRGAFAVLSCQWGVALSTAGTDEAKADEPVVVPAAPPVPPSSRPTLGMTGDTSPFATLRWPVPWPGEGTEASADSSAAGAPPQAGAPGQAVTNLAPELKSFAITKPFDSASPDLFLACCKKARFPTATLTFRKAGKKKPVVFLRLHLRDVYVEAVDLDLKPGDQSGLLPEETVQFVYGACQVEYAPQAETGGRRPPSIKGWDRQQNKEWGS